MPQTDTFATPGMLISRGRICQRANTDICTSEAVSDRMAIMATRLVEDVGWIMIGGVPTFGSALAWVIRSWVSCLAASRSVPGSNCRSIADRPGIDLDL